MANTLFGHPKHDSTCDDAASRLCPKRMTSVWSTFPCLPVNVAALKPILTQSGCMARMSGVFVRTSCPVLSSESLEGFFRPGTRKMRTRTGGGDTRWRPAPWCSAKCSQGRRSRVRGAYLQGLRGDQGGPNCLEMDEDGGQCDESRWPGPAAVLDWCRCGGKK